MHCMKICKYLLDVSQEVDDISVRVVSPGSNPTCKALTVSGRSRGQILAVLQVQTVLK